MFRLIARAIIAVVVNALGLLAASYYIKGFNLNNDFREILVLAAVFTAIYFILRPIVKMILGPFLVLTLGLGLIVVNAAMLYLLDLASKNLMIDGVGALLEATLLLSVLNFVLHYAEKE
ncbi:MAG: putative membrane protein [Parcubacteria group bacterium LiPW_15]|nr:MAG: putative membrane protein [Parcubacteria group bacterium LiPW_15]